MDNKEDPRMTSSLPGKGQNSSPQTKPISVPHGLEKKFTVSPLVDGVNLSQSMPASKGSPQKSQPIPIPSSMANSPAAASRKAHSHVITQKQASRQDSQDSNYSIANSVTSDASKMSTSYLSTGPHPHSKPELASHPSMMTSSSTINSNAPGHKMSRSSLRVNIVAESWGIMPSFASIFSLDDLEPTHTYGLGGNQLDMSVYPEITTSQKDLKETLDMLDNPAYTDTVRSTDSTASLLRRSMSVPGNYTHKEPSGRIRAKEVFEDFLPKHAGTNGNVHHSCHSIQEESLERPDYTDSLQSTSSGTALLARTAISLKQDIKPVLTDIHEEASMSGLIDPKVCKRNLFVLSSAFTLSFSSYTGLRNLQSSLVEDGSLALYALSCIYGSLFIGCLFSTTIVQRLRPKNTMTLGLSALMLHVLSNIYPHYYTLIPASIIVGFMIAIMWTAHATYIINMAVAYSEGTGQSLQLVLTKFNGIFFAFFGFSQILGGIVGSVVLIVFTPDISDIDSIEYNHYMYNSSYSGNHTAAVWNISTTSAPAMMLNFSSLDTSINATTHVSACGGGFCLSSHVPLPGPSLPKHALYTLLGIYAVFVLLGIIVLVACLDKLEGEMKRSHASLAQQFTAVFVWFYDRRVMQLVGVMCYTLIQMAFMFGEFTKAFITCPLGMHLVGFGMMCLSLSSSLSSYMNARMAKALSRLGLFLLAGSIQFFLLILMLFWTPEQSTLPMLFIIMTVWGLADGVWITQVISLMGMLFHDNKEPAFAGLKMCQAFGACATFLTARYMCTSTKIIVIIFILILAMVGLVSLEMTMKLEEKHKATTKKQPQPVKV